MPPATNPEPHPALPRAPHLTATTIFPARPPPPPHTPTARAPAAARATERLAPARVRLGPRVRAHPFPHGARSLASLFGVQGG